MKRTRRALTGIMIAGLVAIGLASPLAAAGRNVKLVVRVFRVPNPQSFDAMFLDGQGKLVPFQGSGDVTSSFPRATVFFTTELAANASEGAVAGAILDRVSFGSGGMSIRKLRVQELKAFEFEIGPDSPKAEARFEESRGEGRTSDYEVRVEFLSSGEGKAVVRLRFDAGWSARGGSLGMSMSEDVISAPFEIPESKLLLIGVAASGTVYWLAVSAAGPAK
jgi:hypothetical protein